MNQEEQLRIIVDRRENLLSGTRNYYRFHLWLKKKYNEDEKAFALCECLRSGFTKEIESDYVVFIDKEYNIDVLTSIENEKKRSNG